ncbi:MAG: phospholipase D-like domain-containing protein [Bacteroidota bacterium]
MSTYSDNDVLIFGGNNGKGYFVDTQTGALISGSPVTFLFGNLVTEPVISNGVAYLGLSNPQNQATAIHIMEVATATDLVPGGIQLAGSTSATPGLFQSYMFTALSSGVLYLFDVSEPASPNVVTTFTFASQQDLTVSANIINTEGNIIYIFTSKGIYAIDVSFPMFPVLKWNSELTLSFLDEAPVLAGGYLYVASGNELFAYNLADDPTNQSIIPEWTWTNPHTADLASPVFVGYNQLLLGDTSGNFYLVGVNSRSLNAGLTLSGASEVNAKMSTFNKDSLYLVSSTGTVYAYSLSITASGATTTQVWAKNYTNTGNSPPTLHFQRKSNGFGFQLYLTGSDGHFYAIDATDGSQVYSTPLAGATGPVFTGYRGGIARAVASTAQVGFLLDGQNFFPTLRNMLLAVANNSFNVQASQIPANPNLLNVLSMIPAAGYDLYVLLWDVGTFMRKGANALEKYGGIRIGFNLNANIQLLDALNQNPSLHLHTALEVYAAASNYVFLESNHQKIVIVSVDGSKLALVAGLNLSGEYYDDVTHPNTPPSFHTWHDTAVVLQGPAVDLVEKEFDRRWSLYGSGSPKASTTSYAKVGYWEAFKEVCLDNPNVCTNSATPTPYTDPRPTGSTVNLEVLLTNFDQLIESEIYQVPLINGFLPFYRPLSQIRAGLVGAISQATDYIYFENVSFYDVPLVQALVDRALMSSDDFKVIIMIPQPSYNDGSGQKNYNILSKTAYVYMKLGMKNWDSFKDINNQEYKWSDYNSQKLYAPENAVEKAYITLTNSSGTSVSVLIVRIASIVSNDKKFILCGPARYFSTQPSGTKNAMPAYSLNYRNIYIHSKLALFDDQKAMVGSANFTARSMYQDGELSVLIDDAATALQIRTQLFEHWGMSTPANWEADISAFKNTSTDGLGVLPIAASDIPSKDNQPSYIQLLITEV